jgi:hypothetical protein
VIRIQDIIFNTKKKFRIDNIDFRILIRDEINIIILQIEAIGRVNKVEAVDNKV